MDPPTRKNHNSIAKVVVPQKVFATISDMESYQNWMSSKTTETGKGQQLELSDLPDDLTESILERLSSTDRVRFGATCKKNLSFFVTQQHPYQYQLRTIDKLPWMATFLPGGLVDGVMVCRLHEPRQQPGPPHYADCCYADYLLRYPEGQIKACKKGWFLSNRREKGMTCLLLFCPFNKRILKLPQLNCKNRDLSSCHATFSSDDPSSPECVFFFLTRYITPDKHRISTLNQKSGKWKTKRVDILIDSVCSVVYHEGCFYCLSMGGELAAYDVVQQTWNLVRAPFFPSHSTDQLSLVACEGKLILASVDLASYKKDNFMDLLWHNLASYDEDNNLVVDVASYDEDNNLDRVRCGLFEFNSSTSTWVEKTSLGDHALFLGLPASFTVPVPSGSNVADRMYLHSYWMDEDSPIYYSFKDGRCHMSENGDYWSGVKRGMWIEPPPTS